MRRRSATRRAAPRRRRRRNPGLARLKGFKLAGFSVMAGPGDILAVTAGAFAANALPNYVAAQHNYGWKGYVMNLLSGGVAAAVTKMLTRSTGMAYSVLVGAGSATLWRWLYTQPWFQAQLSGGEYVGHEQPAGFGGFVDSHSVGGYLDAGPGPQYGLDYPDGSMAGYSSDYGFAALP